MTDVLDANGWPIRKGARIYAPPRPSTIVPGHEVPSVRGRVISTRVDDRGQGIVEVVEFGSFARRTLLAERVRVQRGETKGSEEFDREREALERRPVRRRRVRSAR